jgi:CheY-like chemotaxis protein
MRDRRPILIVDDDEIDAMTVKRALLELNVGNKVQTVCNGEEALAFLRNPKQKSPCLIFLDLNMPRMNGIEFLKIAKDDERLKIIPVVVLTTSREEKDKMHSFNLGVAGYMVKPADYRQFVEVMRTVDLYWTLSEIPGQV